MAEPNTRRLSYMDRYARAMVNYYTSERIAKEIEDEQQRVQYLDTLIADERRTIYALREALPGQVTDLSDANRVLQAQIAEMKAKGEYSALEAALGEQATTLSREEADAIAALKGADSSQALQGLKNLMRQKPGAAYRVLAAAQTELTRELSPKALEDLETEAREQAAKYKAPRASTKAVEEAFGEFGEALTAAYFAGPSGPAAGTREAFGEAQNRKLTAEQLRAKGLQDRAKALEATDYSTEQEALEAALAVVRGTGSPSEITDKFARDIYNRTSNEGSYRNDQRADFDAEILEAIRKRTRLEAEREQIAGAYDDPRIEAAIRNLRAQGYKVEDTKVKDAEGNWVRNPNSWKNAYVMHQGTPMYDYLIGAKELMNKATSEGKPLVPTTKAEQLAIRYTAMRRNQGEKTDLNDLAAQLEKAGIKGDEVTKAVQFTSAYWNLGGKAQSAETMRSLRKQEEIAQAERDHRQSLADQKRGEIDRQSRLIERETRQIERGETMAQRQAVRGIRRGERRTTREMSRDFQRYRGMGMSVEEAREMAGFGVPTAPVYSEPPLNAESVPLPDWVQKMAEEEAAPPKPKLGQIGYEFKDPSDPRSPTYRRTSTGFEVLNDKGEVTDTIPATNRWAYDALEFAEAGDLKGIEQVKKAKEEARKTAGGGGKGGGGQEFDDEDPYSRRPGESDADYAKRLETL